MLLTLRIILPDGSTSIIEAESVAVYSSLESVPPPAGGYFPLTKDGDFPVPAGQFSSLPDDEAAWEMVHQSTWEPRVENSAANLSRPPTDWVVPPPDPKDNPYPAHVWARVTGACPLEVPTTDELIQWVAAKWGLSDEVIRAQLVQESNWYQGLLWSDSMPPSVLERFGLIARPPECPIGAPVFGCGYGDFAPGKINPDGTPSNTHGSPDIDPGRQYNKSLGGELYDNQFSGSRVNGPESFGIPQCRWFANTSPGPTGFGCYPYTELSTSVALDVYAATIRAQYEGWNSWMHGTYDAYKDDPGGAEGVRGSIANWYGSDWKAALPPEEWTGTKSQEYLKAVLMFLEDKPWLKAGF